MSSGDEGVTLSPQQTAALEELRQRLSKPETVRLALRQYVVSEIVQMSMGVDDGGPALTLSATSAETSNTSNDDGTVTVCVTESYSILGFEVYSHTVCDTVSATGTGTVHTTVTH